MLNKKNTNDFIKEFISKYFIIEMHFDKLSKSTWIIITCCFSWKTEKNFNQNEIEKYLTIAKCFE